MQPLLNCPDVKALLVGGGNKMTFFAKTSPQLPQTVLVWAERLNLEGFVHPSLIKPATRKIM